MSDCKLLVDRFEDQRLMEQPFDKTSFELRALAGWVIYQPVNMFL